MKPGRIVILNGPPRAGKSSIASAVQETFDGVWMNLGVDSYQQLTPERLRPGIGLRPGGERPDLEPLIVTWYAALYDAIAAHSRLGLNVVVDAVHHDSYSVPLGILPACARRLAGLPVWFVGVHCPIDVVLERRRTTWGGVGYNQDGTVADPVSLWHRAVHTPGVYDVEVDTSVLSADECAAVIRQHLESGPAPTAFQRLGSGLA
ncbi:chloramphenicol phosphotransferase CPT family protein [Kribbella sp. NPDC051587]|uniref:chloramphenicol phosphotransferase CPT family protein n=1 Tax=Kribbella sp. NPDC051587 TaxID=3364119 RepID=UPI0037AD0E25